MIAVGIAAGRPFDDDRFERMERSISETQTKGSLAFELCEGAALAARAQAALDTLRQRLAAFAETDEPLHRLDAEELELLACMGEDVAELSAQIALILDRLPLESLVVSHHEVAGAARDALADGIADHRRALMAAGFLTATPGFPALAEALCDSDAHRYWPVRVIDVLAAFRDIDARRARQVAALAGVAGEARFCDLPPERVLELAQTLQRFAAR